MPRTRTLLVMSLLAAPGAWAEQSVIFQEEVSVEATTLTGTTVPGLRFDPFKRPVLKPEKTHTEAPPPDDTIPPLSAELRATLVAGEGSMANVAGVIVTIGEEIAGYRLVAVHERKAVFEKDGTRTVLSIE